MSSHSAFISSRMPRSGSLLISLGVMHLLKRSFPNVAFFKPVVLEKEDADCQFIKQFLKLKQPLETMQGMGLSETMHLISEEGVEGWHQQVLERIEKLKESYDFVLIHGVGSDSELENELPDADLALSQQLDCPLFEVFNGKGLTLNELQEIIELESHKAEKKRLPIETVFINRTEISDEDRRALQAFKADERPFLVFVLPEVPELDQPTFKEVALALHGEWLFKTENASNRLISHTLVAAMTPEHYLNYLVEGAQIITPGDRSDILLATFTSLSSQQYPNVSGLILTGGLRPAESIQRLLSGCETQDLPILSVQEDTYTTAVKAKEVPARLLSDNVFKVSLALVTFQKAVKDEVLLDKISRHRPQIMTPLMFQNYLFKRARREKRTILLPESDDDRILQAAEIILQHQVCDIVLLGTPAKVRQRAQLLGVRLEGVMVFDWRDADFKEALAQKLYELRKAKGMTLSLARDSMNHLNYFSTMLLEEAWVDGLVAGAIQTTADTVRPALQIIKTPPDVVLVSSVFFMCFQTRVLVFGDCAINQDPDEQALAQIAISSADTARQFGIEPLVAMLSYSTGQSGSGEEVDKVKQATQIVKQRRPDLIVDGPLQYDAAIDPEVAKHKSPNSPVAGRATVFIFPDLNSGNIAYKAAQRSANAVAIGPVLQGLRKPVNDLSRGAEIADIVNTIAVTAIQAQQNAPTEKQLPGETL